MNSRTVRAPWQNERTAEWRRVSPHMTFIITAYECARWATHIYSQDHLMDPDTLDATEPADVYK